jgi:hypothetical protein
MAGQIGREIAQMNLDAEGNHWTSKRAVNCPYASLAGDQHFAGTPMNGIPPFRHVDGISFLETHYGRRFRPMTAAGLGAALYRNPGSRGIVYVVWKSPPNTAVGSRGAHVFNVVSRQGRTGVHVFIVDVQSRSVDPAYFRDADPRFTQAMRTD